jgi:para-aminobenzoate synthetase
MKTLLIDNYDSYTFNLFQLIAEINGESPEVIKNDQAKWSDLAKLSFDNIVISPGPGSPEIEGDFGVCRDALAFAEVPVLGVCLGHQGLGLACGGYVAHAPEPVHGRRSLVFHDGSELFAGIPQGIAVVRYHSLIVGQPLPVTLARCAWTADGLVMGLRHRQRPLWGVQFHPESIATESGREILRNFSDLTKKYQMTRHLLSSRPHDSTTSLANICTGPAQGQRPKSSATRLVIKRVPRASDPEAAFGTLFAQQPYAFWLDSSRAEAGLSRYSFMGDATGPLSEVVSYWADDARLSIRRGRCSVEKRHQSIFGYIESRLAEIEPLAEDIPFDFFGGFVGYFGYELKSECGGDAAHRSALPDAMSIFADHFIAFDHDDGMTYLAALAPADAEATFAEKWFAETMARLDTAVRRTVKCSEPSAAWRPVEFELHHGYEQYLRDIQSCKSNLFAGESYEICLTTQLRTTEVPDSFALYTRLRQVNPAPYSSYLRFGELAVLSSSPERFLKIDRHQNVEAKPIKGTRRRGRTAEEDNHLRDDLRSNDKDRAENLMIVDLLRNDLGMVCEVGSVHVPKLMEVETYPTVHQLVSTIRGKLRRDLRATDALRAAFPAGSMTGAPKIRTMKIIDELEGEARGIYSGALGYVSLNGALDLSVVIRTIISTPHGLSMGIGGAIVVQSDPDDEFEEILLKARALIHAVVLATRGAEGAYRIVNGRVMTDLHLLERSIVAESTGTEGTVVRTLEELRNTLDTLDARILSALGERLDTCREIARYKKEHALDVMQPDRVGLVTKRYEENGERLGFRADVMRQIASLIIEESCRIETTIIAAASDASPASFQTTGVGVQA